MNRRIEHGRRPAAATFEGATAGAIYGVVDGLLVPFPDATIAPAVHPECRFEATGPQAARSQPETIMAHANLLNASPSTFLDLIGNGRMYLVPPYQRDYSWREEHWDDLWSDIVEVAEGPDGSHYMGALVIEARSDREFAVIDGQQRLATLSILALAVIAELRAMADGGVHPEANRERANALRNRYIGEKDPASLVEASKLRLNANDDGFYQDYLVQLRTPRNPRRLSKSNQLLWNCFAWFRSRLSEYRAESPDGARLAGLISEVVGRRLMFIRITVDNELSAYTVFETLNARGLELSSTDLLKNFLFSQLSTPSDLEALQRRWQTLIASVRQERFPEFLRYHLQCDISRVRKERLFKLVRERIKGGVGVFELMDALERRADLFDALTDDRHPLWADRGECRPHIRNLVVMRVRQMTPLVFAAFEKFSPPDFARVLKLIATLLFRWSAIGGQNTNALEMVAHESAKGVLGGTLNTPAEVFAALRKIHLEDDEFERAFERFAPDSGGQGKRLVRSILARLESDASGRSCDPDVDRGSIEHILPQNPSSAWDDEFPIDQWARWVDRLGNLTWLEDAANRRLANAEFAAKREAYANSVYALSRAIPESFGDEWSPAKIEARQKEMARRAVHLWRVDFA